MKLFMPNFGFPDFDDETAPPVSRVARLAQRNAEIAAAYQDGFSVAELAQQHGLTAYQIRYALKGEGVAMRRRGPSSGSQKPDRDAVIIEKYKAGVPTTQLDKEFGITRERVCQILRKENLTNLKTERKRIARETAEAERQQIAEQLKAVRAAAIEQAVEVVRNGGSRNDAIRATGLPHSLVCKACLDAGLPHHHGRWRREHEFEERKARIRAMRAAGKTWDEIGRSNYSWAVQHLPELIKHRTMTEQTEEQPPLSREPA